MGDHRDRPLMTFALFTYNQERFIREAVQGAFAQTYEPLEIILSDDCSTDHTFEIMQEMAATYEGNHKVVLRKTTNNLGVVGHVVETCKNAKGEVVVVAAGDDISYPERVESIVRAIEECPSAFCITTGYDVIDEYGALISTGNMAPLRVIKSFVLLPDGEKHIVTQGSTAAYRREFFSLDFPRPLLPCAEDYLFNFMIYANGKHVTHLPLSLVAYRQHQNALANYDKKSVSAREAEIASMDRHAMQEHLLLNMRSVIGKCSAPERINQAELATELCNVRERMCWGHMSTRERLACVLRAIESRQLLQLIWQLPRLWGRFPDYFPNTYTRPLELLLQSRVRRYLQGRG